jgi:hypothetical protein
MTTRNEVKVKFIVCQKKNTHKATSRGFAKNKYPQAKVKFIGCQKNNVIFFLKVYFQDIEFFLWALKATSST